MNNVKFQKKYQTASDLFGKQLMFIPGVTDSIAIKITNKYPTIRVLYNAYMNCNGDINKEKKLLFNNIETIQYNENKLDDDLKYVCSLLTHEQKHKPISVELSERIWCSIKGT